MMKASCPLTAHIVKTSSGSALLTMSRHPTLMHHHILGNAAQAWCMWHLLITHTVVAWPLACLCGQSLVLMVSVPKLHAWMIT